jgi:hypothetical protein
MPRVAINGWSFILVMRSPLIAPRPNPITTPTRSPTIGGAPLVTTIPTETMTTAKVDPTERSIPAVMIAKVIPIARRPLIVLCSTMSIRLALRR